jgi:hypothetical protein
MFERLGLLPYPNPSTGVINFTAEVDIEVYDIVGKLIRKENNVLYVKLNKGIYLIKISKDNLNITNKIIIE